MTKFDIHSVFNFLQPRGQIANFQMGGGGVDEERAKITISTEKYDSKE